MREAFAASMPPRGAAAALTSPNSGGGEAGGMSASSSGGSGNGSSNTMVCRMLHGRVCVKFGQARKGSIPCMRYAHVLVCAEGLCWNHPQCGTVSTHVSLCLSSTSHIPSSPVSSQPPISLSLGCLHGIVE